MDFFSIGKELTTFKKEVKIAFQKVQEESDEHLDSINENTTEIQSLQSFCEELDCKIDKLAEKIDNIYLVLEQVGLVEKKPVFNKLFELTKSESEIYGILKSSEDDLSYLDISHNTGFDQESIKSILASLVKKGVPIVQTFLNNVAYITMQKEFKEEKGIVVRT
ncbi:hypothetical protein JXM83_00315 [Candidatus Woesearchaeota archaeon]|nr:hypothetical protein [Candidatus Woesearchaeota archaeon]